MCLWRAAGSHMQRGFVRTDRQWREMPAGLWNIYVGLFGLHFMLGCSGFIYLKLVEYKMHFFVVFTTEFSSFNSKFNWILNHTVFSDMPILVAARSKALLYGRSVTGISGSKPAGRMNVSGEYCVLLGRGFGEGSVTGPEESYRVSCARSWSRNLIQKA